jgi:colanic acid/amylovoran biosynthesis glycosyltransferase
MTARQVAGPDQRQHVYVVDRFPSYSETFVSTEITSLLAMGTAVSVYSIHPPKAKFEGAAPYVARPLTAVRMLPWAVPGLVLLLCNFARGLRLNLRGLPKMMFASAHAARLAAAVLDINRGRDRQLVLHGHFLARPADVVGLAALWIPGAPVLMTSHAGDAKDRRDPKLRNWRIGSADHILAASQYVLNNLADEPTRASIVHCGIETSKLLEVRPLRTDDGLAIITVARLIQTKGYERAIAIISALADRSRAPLTWHIVGEGPMHKDIEAARDTLSTAGVKVVLHGALDHGSTLQIVASCDVFLLPSQVTKSSENAGDGIPVAILEGMALGKLVVTTRAGGIPEAVVDGQTGLLITTESDEEIAERIVQVMSDDVIHRGIRARAQSKVRDEFEATASAVAIQQIVSSILSDPNSRTNKKPIRQGRS